MKKLTILLLILCICFTGCSQPKQSSIDIAAEQIIYNFSLDYFEYDSGARTLTFYELPTAVSQEKPVRYFIYEDYMYLKHYLPEVDITLIYEYEDKPFIVRLPTDLEELPERYGALDKYVEIHPLKKEDHNGWVNSQIEWATHAGIRVPDFTSLENIGIVRDKVFSEDYILRSADVDGKPLSHGKLVDSGIKNKAIYATITFGSSSGRPIKCALYDDLCKLLYKKFKRQDCEYRVEFLCKSEFRFGETTNSWPAIVIEGPSENSSDIFERIAKHEQITYGEFEEQVVRTLHAPYGVLVESIAEAGLTDVAITY